MIEWGDNGEISDTSPTKYVPLLSKRFDETELAEMQYWHALPDNWQDMPYQEFLRKRRERMAIVIRDAYKKLAGDATTSGKLPVLPVTKLVAEGEGTNIEFKSTLRINLHTRQKDSKMELAVLKTVAAFLNMSGGTLVIGVADDGEPVGNRDDEVIENPNDFIIDRARSAEYRRRASQDIPLVIALCIAIIAFIECRAIDFLLQVGVDNPRNSGIEADEFPSEDNMNLHLVNLIKERMGMSSMMYVHPRFDDYHDARVMVLDCVPSKVPVFVKDRALERFYVRTGAATSELTASQTQDFIKQRFSH
jgi:Putative DNA-binding domain